MNSKEALKELLAMATLCLNKKAIQRLAVIKKDLEILEIIKTKSVDISLIKNCYGPLAYALYNSYIDEEKNDELTKQEYDLLKEWLEDDK